MKAAEQEMRPMVNWAARRSVIQLFPCSIPRQSTAITIRVVAFNKVRIETNSMPYEYVYYISLVM
jgi:hypothetical protein